MNLLWGYRVLLLQVLSLEEIADITKAPLGTVKSRLFYGQQRLRDLLSDLDPNGIKE